jgi:hypothetical protein
MIETTVTVTTVGGTAEIDHARATELTSDLAVRLLHAPLLLLLLLLLQTQ